MNQGFFFLCLVGISCSIDLKTYEEGTGLSPAVTQLDVNWLFSVKEWHFSGGSKYGLFRFLNSFHVKPLAELGESDLETCIATTISKSGVVWLHAFGKREQYGMKLRENPALIDWRIIDAEKEENQTVGLTYVTMTDNKTYFVTIQLWDRVTNGWLLMTTEKAVSSELRSKVLEHIKQLGFNPDLAFFKDFSTCPPETFLD